MFDALTEKTFKNALLVEKLLKIDKNERKIIIERLLKKSSERKLGEELGIPHSTIHDWRTLRQNNKGEHIHVSLSLIYRRLSNLNPEQIKDWGRIKMIKDKCEELLLKKIQNGYDM